MPAGIIIKYLQGKQPGMNLLPCTQVSFMKQRKKEKIRKGKKNEEKKKRGEKGKNKTNKRIML